MAMRCETRLRGGFWMPYLRSLLGWTLSLLLIGSLLSAPAAQASTPTMSAAPATPAGFARHEPSPAPSWLDSTTRGGRVTVRAPVHLRAVARRLADAAESALTRIATDLDGLPAPGLIEVRLVDDASELPRVAPSGRGAPPYAVGVAYPDLGVVSIAMRRGAEPQDAEATLRHELAHIALGAALGEVPRWLHEGFAYQHSAEWSLARTETLAGMVWFHTIIPLTQLDNSFPAQEMATHRAYAESYDFVGYLSRRGRWDDKSDDGDRFPFRRFLAGLSHGDSMDLAAIRAFGRPIGDLFEEWRSDISNRLMFAPVGLFALGLWVVAAILLVLGSLRRRRQARATMARWAMEDEQRRHQPFARDDHTSLGNLGIHLEPPSEDGEEDEESQIEPHQHRPPGQGADRPGSENEDDPVSPPSGRPRYWN
jgi:Peptidase MA superfamily